MLNRPTFGGHITGGPPSHSGRQTGTWQEKGRNHGRSPSESRDLARKRPKTEQVPLKNQGPGQKKAEIMEGPPWQAGTWHEKGRNHGRSPSGSRDLARKRPKSWKVPLGIGHRRPAKRLAGLLAVPGGDCGGLLGVPSSPPPTACPVTACPRSPGNLQKGPKMTIPQGNNPGVPSKSAEKASRATGFPS